MWMTEQNDKNIFTTEVKLKIKIVYNPFYAYRFRMLSCFRLNGMKICYQFLFVCSNHSI